MEMRWESPPLHPSSSGTDLCKPSMKRVLLSVYYYVLGRGSSRGLQLAFLAYCHYSTDEGTNLGIPPDADYIMTYIPKLGRSLQDRIRDPKAHCEMDLNENSIEHLSSTSPFPEW